MDPISGAGGIPPSRPPGRIGSGDRSEPPPPPPPPGPPNDGPPRVPPEEPGVSGLFFVEGPYGTMSVGGIFDVRSAFLEPEPPFDIKA